MIVDTDHINVFLERVRHVPSKHSGTRQRACTVHDRILDVFVRLQYVYFEPPFCCTVGLVVVDDASGHALEDEVSNALGWGDDRIRRSRKHGGITEQINVSMGAFSKWNLVVCTADIRG